MSVLNQSGEEQVECPLCLEPLEVDDLNFFPCTCGYQICRFCWHRIRTDENGLCPACRKAYSENPADFKPLSQEEVARLKAEKRQKDQQRKQKITENRKHLANIRVVQQNLVFVVGLPMRLADSEVLKKHEYFGKFGKIQKVVINQSTSYAGSQGPSASAYVTYLKADDALRAIQAVNNISVDGRTVKTSLGTTKYCSNFMKNQPCLKADCMYLHELGDPDASFTKEEMQLGKHQEYEKKLHEQLLSSINRDRKPTPSPPAVSCQGENNNVTQGNQSCGKEAWPSLQPGFAAGSSGNGTFGLSNGTGISNTNNSNNGSNNSSKSEISQRKQRFDQQATKVKSQKLKHTPGEDNKGKSKEKCVSNVQDEHGTVGVHRKSEELQHSNSSFKECSPDMDGSTHHKSEFIFGTTGEEADLQENDTGNCSGQQVNSRILLTNHTSTLFEPDNNSFFSTNNFTKVSTTIPGSGTTDWLPLTHMPDVLPPVHSSEDWQAAFGFANSTCPTSQHQKSGCVAVPLEKYQIESYSSELCSKRNGNSIEVVEPGDQEQSQENNSSLLGHVSPYPIQVSKLGEEVRLSSDSDGCLSQNMGTGCFEVNKIPNSRIPLNHPPSTSNSGDSSQQTMCHSTFVQDPTVIMLHPDCHIVNNLTNHIVGSQHIIPNGLLPLQTASKFFADIHLRQQSLHNHSTVFESANLSSRIPGTSDCSKFSVISDTNLSSPFGNGQGNCIVNSRNEFQSGSDNIECILKDKYHSNFHNHQQKHLEPEIDLEFKCNESNPQRLLATSIGSSEQISIKDGGRLTDDELGFDPFHETQKALAEMMEKESMMVTMQNKQSSCYLFHNQQNHVNQLSSSKLLNSFNNQNHILPQQNNRLPPNISNCTKLLNGLGLGPSSVTAARTRLPPPGFTTAPNHMNAFGLGIPRAPSSSCSKILPFMGLGNSSNCSPPPVPQTVATHPQHQGVLFSSSHTFGLENASGETLHMKEWPDNFQPLLNSQNVSTPPPPPASFGSPSMHGSLQKGWNGTDWTALDPAIVSSSCPPNFLAVSHSANLGLSVVQMDHELHQNNADHCRLYSNNPVAPPPPGFSSVTRVDGVIADDKDWSSIVHLTPNN